LDNISYCVELNSFVAFFETADISDVFYIKSSFPSATEEVCGVELHQVQVIVQDNRCDFT